MRLKNLARLVTECEPGGIRPYVSLDIVGGGSGRLTTQEPPERDAPATGAASVRPGDVLFGKLRPYLAKTWLVDRSAYASTELLCLRACEGVEPRWLAYLCTSRPLLDWSIASSDGTKMPRTSWEKLAEFQISAPAMDAQRRIADYLDSETARIDALISKRQHMIELLEERRLVTMSEIVMGRDASEEMQADSVLGLLPRRWRVMRLRHVVDITVGVVVNPSSYFVDDGVPFIHGSDVRDGWIDTSSLKRLSPESNESLAKSQLHTGDVVVVRAGYPGRAAVVRAELDGANCASILILRRGERMLPEYLCHFLNTREARLQVSLAQYGAAQEQINVSDIVDFSAPVPSGSEQEKIVGRVDTFLRSHTRSVEKLVRQVELLAERRQALITAAVSGGLVIPEVAA
jgi:type I restriction enzyme S subunit